MITNNAYNCYAAGAFRKTGKFNRYDGSEYSCYMGSGNASVFGLSSMGSWANNASSYGIQFGNGTTEPAPTDYNLSGTVLGTDLAVSVKRTREEDTDGVTHTAVLTITNNNAADVTISEVGLFQSGYYPYGNNSSETPMMVDRTLLDAPLTIPAGEVGQLTYTIRINFPELPTA